MASRLIVAVILMCITLCSGASFDRPTITSLTPANIPIDGGSVTIVGTNLDQITDITTVEIGGAECTFGGSITSDTIVCDAPQGYGKNVPVTISWTADVGNSIPAGSATANIATYVAASDAALCALGTDGPLHVVYPQGASMGVTVTVCGSNFGEYDGMFEGPFSVVVVGGYPATILDHSDSKVAFTLPYQGNGVDLAVRINLGSQSLVINGLTVSFPKPVVISVEINNLDSQKRLTWANVIIKGRNFGLPGTSPSVQAFIGTIQCVNLQHISDTLIKCSALGSGANLPVTVVINGVTSAPDNNEYGSTPARFTFIDVVTPGLSCVPPFGSVDAINLEMCNCWSGSASTDQELQTDCDVHARCPGQLIAASAVAQSSPRRPTTSFMNDKLMIKQVAPIVSNRRDTIIQFAIPNLGFNTGVAGDLGADTCFYPGTIWKKNVNSLDCLDEYTAEMPWSQHDLCGFVEDTAAGVATTRFFKSNLITTYTETFKRADGSIHFRKISNSYLLTVSFMKRVTAITTTFTVIINDEQAPTSLSVVIDGDALYDVATKDTIISFTTTIAWPYQIAETNLVGYWRRAANNAETQMIDANAVLAATQSGDAVCEQVADTECEQQWVLTISTAVGATADVCNIAGTLEFSTGTLDCRDYDTVAECAVEPSTNFTIVIGKTDLCDQDTSSADASAGLTHKLETFFDSEFTQHQSIFQTGDMVYAKLTLNDPTSTIDEVTFNSITLSASDNAGLEDVLYAVADSTYGAVAPNGDYFFNKTMELDTQLAPSADGSLKFSFRLIRLAGGVLEALSSASSSDLTKQLTITAALDILYHGNDNSAATKKRAVVVTNTVPTITHSQISFYDTELVDALEPHNNDEALFGEEFSLFGSSASTVAASFAVVAAAALVLA